MSTCYIAGAFRNVCNWASIWMSRSVFTLNVGYAVLSVHHPNSSNAVLYPPLTVNLPNCTSVICFQFRWVSSFRQMRVLPVFASPVPDTEGSAGWLLSTCTAWSMRWNYCTHRCLIWPMGWGKLGWRKQESLEELTGRGRR